MHDLPSDGTPVRIRVADPQRPLRVRGGTLDHVELEIQSWGAPNAERSNGILLCHSFSADSFAAGSDPSCGPGHRQWRSREKGWWDALVGPGKALDTDRHWVVCSNVLGGSGGSTGPASEGPDGSPWGIRFPFISIQDMVQAQTRLADELGVVRWEAVVGGSLGGLQALGWAFFQPDRLARAVAIAVAARPSLSGIGHFAAGCAYIRREIESGGDGHQGLLASFATGRHYSGPGDPRSDLAWKEAWPLERYHPWTYERLAEALMTFDLASDLGEGDLVRAARAVACPVDLFSFQGDLLFPPADADILAAAIRKAGGKALHQSLPGPFGHDTFLESPLGLDGVLRSVL